ncbi:MAG: ABC transporter substrate-binding protein [Kofleriaceae bacterium]|nr:ABC transporter substrate-binding protein [Kofleriaceae bacterium]
MGGDKNKSQGGSGSNAAAAGASTNVATGPILIGHYASMTGAEATFGQSTDNGVRLALEERNAKGGVKGRKVEIKTLDTASKASEGKTVVTRLINEDHVVALLGEVASKISLEGGKVAQQFSIPMISPSSTNAKVTELGNMISRVCFIDGFQGYVMAKFAKGDLKFDKVAILYDQAAPYSKGLAEDFTSAYTGMGGAIATKQEYSAGDVDVAAQLGNIKKSGAQAVYLPGYYTDVGNIVRQARKQGVTVPFLGGDGWDSSKLTEIGGEAIEGSYYSNHYSFEEQRPEVQEFVSKYKAKFGEVPDGLAALGYDAARVLFDAMERSPSLGGNDLAATIAATKDFPGVTGTITLDAKRDAVKKAVVLQIKGGKPAYVTSVSPQGMADNKAPVVPPVGADAEVRPGADSNAKPTPATEPATGAAAAPAAIPAAVVPALPPTSPKALTEGKGTAAAAPVLGGAASEPPKSPGKRNKRPAGEASDPDDGGE